LMDFHTRKVSLSCAGGQCAMHMKPITVRHFHIAGKLSKLAT
jgi:hypothetical protein